jgi:hypothetical protein
MDEKHLLEMAGIDADDWERTPVSATTASSAVRFEDRATRATPERITTLKGAA